jgi:hypothetical protein
MHARWFYEVQCCIVASAAQFFFVFRMKTDTKHVVQRHPAFPAKTRLDFE